MFWLSYVFDNQVVYLSFVFIDYSIAPVSKKRENARDKGAYCYLSDNIIP